MHLKWGSNKVLSRMPSSSSKLAKQGSSTQASVSEKGNKTSGNKDANVTQRTSLLSPASEEEAVHVDMPVTTAAEPAPAPVRQTGAPDMIVQPPDEHDAVMRSVSRIE